ncbi:MAG: ABC transporter permease [Proteobacteria bacterium]|nr:ABC transporter permease [Pseudomonadota bacterium]
MKKSFSPWQSELIKIQAFIFKNWIMTRRNVFTLFEMLFWPVVSFLSVGLLAEFAHLAPEMKAFVLIGVVAMSAVQICQLDVAYALLYDVWSKAVKHGFVVPAGIPHMLLGSLVMGVIRGGAVFVILMAASRLLFRFDFTTPGPLPLLFFVLGLFLSGAMVGLLVCVLVLALGNRAEVAAWSLVSLILLVCGIYYPVTVLPPGVALMAEYIPVTYFLEYFREFYGFKPIFGHVLAKGYALVVLYLVLEVFLMKAALNRAKKKGILLRLSE